MAEKFLDRLLLSGDPVEADEAATKRYVDEATAFAVPEVDGGRADSVYTAAQLVDGGGA